MISVIIPIYNTRKEWLRKAVNSALNQTYEDIEVILVDDCSHEPFSGLESEFRDHRIKLLKNNDNQGVSATRNHGAVNARGGWLAFLDSDDWWEPGKLELQLDLCERDHVKWVYNSAFIVTPEGKIIFENKAQYKGNVLKEILSYQMIVGSCSGVMVDRALFFELGGFDETGNLVEDWDLWIRLSKITHVSYVARPLSYIRMYSSGNRGGDQGKVKRLQRLQQKYWRDIIRFKLEDVAKAHLCSVKAKQYFLTQNFFVSVWNTALNIYYCKGFLKFGKVIRWFKNQHIVRKNGKGNA